MDLDRFEQLFALAAAFCCLQWLSGCETPAQRARVLASVRVEVGEGTGGLEAGKRNYDTDAQWVAVSWAPFAGLAPPTHVVVDRECHR